MREVWTILRGRTTVYSTTGIVFLVVSGLLLLIRPLTAMSLICRLFGMVVLVYGIVSLLRLWKQDTAVFRTGRLAFGILLIIIGASVLGNPLSLVRMSGTLLALFFLGYGLFSALRMHRSDSPRNGRWWLLTAGAVSELVIGILLLASPVRASALVLRLLGIVLLYAALSSIVYRTRIRSEEETWEREARNTIFRFRDTVSRYTGKDSNGKDIIDGTARDVTDDTSRKI